MPAFDTPVWSQISSPNLATTPLTKLETVDLLVIGGGFFGLVTALNAARQGLSVRLVEAGAIGSGASGLNGGQVIPGLKQDPEWLLKHFGPVAGERLIRFVASTADQVFGLIDREQLDVPNTRNGWIYAAHTDKALAFAADRNRQWQARGKDCALLDAAEIKRLTGAEGYLGGWLDRQAGVINPLAFTRELARIAIASGVAIADHCKVLSLRQSGPGWQATTSQGHDIAAKTVLVATNAYSDQLVPGLAQTVLPLHSFQIATDPLPAHLGDALLPEGQAISDSRRILVYYRKSADGRLVLGSRGRMAIPKSPSDWAHIERALIRLFPSLKGVPIAYRWFGRVGMTLDHLPHVHEPAPGLLTVVGCQGRGVALMTALGGVMADAIVSGDRGALPFPITPIRPIPFHEFRQIGIGAMITWYRFLDSLES